MEKTIEPITRTHLVRFWKGLRYQDSSGAGPSVGGLMYNPDLYPADYVIDLYVEWLKAGEPE
jgi:hypothetical protein